MPCLVDGAVQLEAVMGTEIAPAVPENYDSHWERRDIIGVHKQKQEGLNWVGLCVPAGRMSAADMADIGECPLAALHAPPPPPPPPLQLFLTVCGALVKCPAS